MKKVKNIIEEDGQGILTTKGGKKISMKTKTTYTYYDDGTNDCHVQILKPLSISEKNQEVN